MVKKMMLSILKALIPLYGDAYRFRALLRLREICRKKNITWLAICIKNYFLHKFGCELSIYAEISPRALFMHTTGVVIGEGMVIEEGVKIYSGVVCGRKDINNVNDYPIIKKNAILGTGCKVLGKVEVGQNCIIGANSVVMTSTDSGTWCGAPARKVIRRV